MPLFSFLVQTASPLNFKSSMKLQTDRKTDIMIALVQHVRGKRPFFNVRHLISALYNYFFTSLLLLLLLTCGLETLHDSLCWIVVVAIKKMRNRYDKAIIKFHLAHSTSVAVMKTWGWDRGLIVQHLNMTKMYQFLHTTFHWQRILLRAL